MTIDWIWLFHFIVNKPTNCLSSGSQQRKISAAANPNNSLFMFSFCLDTERNIPNVMIS